MLPLSKLTTDVKEALRPLGGSKLTGSRLEVLFSLAMGGEGRGEGGLRWKS
jgi:hypothetical protein